MRLTKALGAAGALILAAMVGGTLIGSTLATEETTDDGTSTDASAYCDTFMDALAAELGTSRDELTAAGRAAANATVDAAVAAGDIDEDRAETLRERIADADGTGCAWFGHGSARGFEIGFERGAIRGFLGAGVLDAAADALGIESSELFDELRDGGSLEALAETHGTSYDELKATILGAVQAELETAVQDGTSQERADAVLDRLTEWLDGGGELGELRPGRGHFGPGRGGFGPWGHDDSNDTDAEESGA